MVANTTTTEVLSFLLKWYHVDNVKQTCIFKTELYKCYNEYIVY